MPNLLLATTGCLQAEQTPRLIRSLLEIPDLDLVVAATPAALTFFDRGEVEDLVGGRLFAGHREGTERFPVPHIHLAEWAELLMVFPASANTLAKCAHGLADNLVTNLVLAARCPVYFGPSMNPVMYENTLVQKNLETLKAAGYQLVPRVPAAVWMESTHQIVQELACTEDTVKAICHHAFVD